MSAKSDLVDVEYDVLKIDDDRYRSVLFVINGREVWLPRSLIEVDVDGGVVTLPEWKAMEMGLI
jgi:hypothetical protein